PDGVRTSDKALFIMILVVTENRFQPRIIPWPHFAHDLRGSGSIIDTRGRHHDGQQQSQGVYQNVALPTSDVLGGIITALPTHLRGFHGLTVDTGRTGSWRTHLPGLAFLALGRLLPYLRPENIVNGLQQAPVPPFGEIGVGGAFR